MNSNYLLRVSLTMPKGKKYNKKTGPIPVSTITAKTCPSACPFKNGNGCYAETGPLAIHWRKITEGERGTDWNTFCEQIDNLPDGQLWRWAQAGDLPNSDGKISRSLVSKLVEANKGKKGFGYSHHNPKIEENSKIFKSCNKNGFTINLSANNLTHADELTSMKIAPVVVVLDHTVDGEQTKTLLTPKGNKVVVCPATYRDDVTCATCQLCQKSNRSCIVGFPAHGTRKFKTSEIVKEY